MNEDPEPPELQSLRDLAELREQPFTSDVPVLGGLIAWFRTTWNNVATTWYVRPQLSQQTLFNQNVVQLLECYESRDQELRRLTAALEQQLLLNQAALERMNQLGRDFGSFKLLADELNKRQVQQDREFANLSHDVGESAARVIQLREALRALEDSPGDDDPAA